MKVAAASRSYELEEREMAWKTINRNKPAADDGDTPQVSAALKEKIRGFFARYPSKRAALLPALHLVQETQGCISHRAMRDVAELLGIAASEVMDTASFYTHYWMKPRGHKVIVACRGLSCELMGVQDVNRAICDHLGIREHETTADGEYSFVTEECLGACECSPCLLINERLHKNVRPQDVPRILADPDNDKVEVERSGLYDGVK
jgi:NADH:ubiquinone oxidoreductase subunit E